MAHIFSQRLSGGASMAGEGSVTIDDVACKNRAHAVQRDNAQRAVVDVREQQPRRACIDDMSYQDWPLNHALLTRK